MISASIGVALTLLAAAAIVMRYVPISSHLTLVMVIAAPFLMLAAPVAVVVLSLGRHWVPAAFAVGLTAALVAIYLPSYLSATPPPESLGIRVMTVNMLYGRADTDALTAEAARNADIVMVQELTTDASLRLAASGLEKTFPFKALDARPAAEGVGIYSRHPLSDVKRVGGFKLALVTAKVAVPGVGAAVSVASIHLSAPWPRPVQGWLDDLAAFPRVLQDLKNDSSDGSVIVAGDFNSTIDMRQFRALLTDGYRDGAEQAGDGRNLTFPANRRFLPPLLGIDHVLTRNATAVSTETVELPRTDHRAVLATVMVPKE